MKELTIFMASVQNLIHFTNKKPWPVGKFLPEPQEGFLIKPKLPKSDNLFYFLC